MDKQYKIMMEQQHIDAEITKHFYGVLEKKQPQRKAIRWQIALAAACIILMIPFTALAAKNIFGTPKIKIGKLDWHNSPNGYSIQFENVDSFPLETFPKEIQTLREMKRIPYNSWEDAEKALRLDLLNNAFLAHAEKLEMDYDDTGASHCRILYNTYEGQLYYVSATANYRYSGLQLDIKAKIAVDHPELDEETKQLLLGLEGVINRPTVVETDCEEYTTTAGIPVVILHWNLDQVIRYVAVFAVNDISYEVTAWVNPDNEEAEVMILKNVLNSFSTK
jgi:hypothetical protein